MRGKLGLVLMGRAMLSKSLIQFCVDGWGYIPHLLFTWDQTMVEVMKIMATSFKRSHAGTATLSVPNPAAGHCQPMPLLETAGHSQASLGQSPVGSLLLSPGSRCTQVSACALQEYISQSCVISRNSMVGLMVSSSKRAYAIPRSAAPKSPCPYVSPLLTHTSTGYAQTQSYLSLCGVPGFWCTQGMSEPSEHL